MRAAYVEAPGPPETIRIGELAAPRPRPGEVLVDVDLTVVNRVDTFVRSGAYRTPMPFPFIVGRDLVGVVADVGDASSPFAEGDAVWCNSLGHSGRQGPTAQRAVVSEVRLYRLPAGVDPGRAVAIAHPAATAHLPLAVHGRVRPGELVIVTGAAGNVGAAAIVQAALGGARVIATAAPHDAGYCRWLGAEHVVDYRDREALRDIRELAPDGVDVYIDAAGDDDLPLVVDLLAPAVGSFYWPARRRRPPAHRAALHQRRLDPRLRHLHRDGGRAGRRRHGQCPAHRRSPPAARHRSVGPAPTLNSR